MESPSMLTPTANVISASSNAPFVHRHYLLLKAHYFLFFSAFGIIYPILNITLRSRGLSNSELAFINLIIPFLIFFTNPLVGFIADHSRRYLSTFNFILTTVTILYAIMFFLPVVKSRNIEANISYDDKSSPVLDFCAHQEVATKCSSRSECGCSYTSYCKNDKFTYNFTFTMSSKDIRPATSDSNEVTKTPTCGIQYRVPIDSYLPDYVKNLSNSQDNEYSSDNCEITCSTKHFCHGVRHSAQTLNVLLYYLLFIIGTDFLTIGITIGASIGFATLSRPQIFGNQRVWGTIGFGISAFLASRLYEHFNTDIVYIIMFSTATVLCIFVTCFIRLQSRTNEQNADNLTNHAQNTADNIAMKDNEKDFNNKSSLRSKVAALIPVLKKIDVIIFLSLTFIWGMSFAPLDPYVYLYIDEVAPCQSHSIVGWMSLIASTAEVFAFFLAARMLKFFGTNACSIFILIAFAIRFGGYYLIRRPYFLLFVEPMQYFNFGILYVLIAQKADAIAPPGLAGTLQGVVYGLSFGLGRGVGLIASSFIYTRLPARLLFLIFAIFDAAAALVYGLYFAFKKADGKKPTHINNNMTIPKIVIDPETNANEEPLLVMSSMDENYTDK